MQAESHRLVRLDKSVQRGILIGSVLATFPFCLLAAGKFLVVCLLDLGSSYALHLGYECSYVGLIICLRV
jgi:hypothetical protein